MSLHRVSRKYHKWLMLFIGIQFLVWSVSGTYMVLMDIHYIHGDTLLNKEKPSINAQTINYSFSDLLSAYPKANNIQLGLMLEQSVYRFTIDDDKRLISAQDGQQLSPINMALAAKIAKQLYSNKNTEVSGMQLITDNPPRELSARHLPVWRIDFEDFASPSFYISVNSAELVTKRHSFWRIFDWMFAFHVMDYIDEAADNKLLLIVSLLAFVASIFGLVLSYFRFVPWANKNKGRNRRAQLLKQEAVNE